MSFTKLKDCYKANYNLKHLTWFKVGGDADFFLKPKNIDDLIIFLKENKSLLPITILGAGSNLIIRDKGVEGVVIKLGRGFSEIEIVNNKLLSAGAGCLNFNLARFCCANAIGGFEFLVGIPGSIGGGIAMNAGCYGFEFRDIVNSVDAVDMQGNIINLSLNDIGFVHRGNSLPNDLIFTRVFFNKPDNANPVEIKRKMDEFAALRRISQPITEKTGGSTFVNPDGLKAWELIDKANLRGAKSGGACISEKHCNFMINYDNASATDLENLGELVRKKVKETAGIELKWEIRRIGRL